VLREKGITLLEMIVVMVIVGMMLALAIGIMRGAAKNLAVPAAVTHLESMIRTARVDARIHRRPSWILFETKERQVSVLTKVPWGMWHFESIDADGVSPGAYERDAKVGGRGRSAPAQLVQGKVGQALRLRSDSWIECPAVPVWSPNQGLAIEFWLLRDDTDATQTIVSIGNGIQVVLKAVQSNVRDCGGCGKRIPTRGLTCPLCGERNRPIARGLTVRGMVIEAKLGKVTLHTYESLPAYRWQHVAVYHAAGEGRIYINGVLLAAKKGEIQWGRPQKLRGGSRTAGIRGCLDELSFSLIVPPDVYLLPRDVNVEFQGNDKPDKNGHYVLHFDRDGALEDARHRNPVTIRMTGPEGQEAWLRFELNGTVSKPPPPKPKAPAASNPTRP
jgi:prepilin-type N-terminal cleavage/methylation domain-containing protein